VDGNRGKRPLPKNEARVPPALPSPPDFLCEVARAEWERVAADLYKVGLLTQLDRAALAAYCSAYARYVKAEQALLRMAAEDPVNGGLMITTTHGNVVQNPMLGIARRAKADALRAAAAFGMTPASRSGVEARPPHLEGDAASEFFD
jgi:P27 family predicted phage terminase small subunit